MTLFMGDLMKLLRLILASVAVLALVGCASGVKRDPGIPAAAVPANTKFSALKVYLNEDAKKLLADNIKFNPETLQSTLQRALSAKNLMVSDAVAQLDIEITDFRVRSNFSAIMFGFMAGNDSVTANVYVKDKAGKVLNKFETSASYALGGLAGGQDSARMDWLYEEFAKVTVNELTGESPK